PPLSSDAGQHLVLWNVSWENYLKIGEALADRPGLRLTYERGRLEFRTTTMQHERLKRFLGRFVETIAEELSVPIAPGGSMTFQRADLKCGIEPDECFWIANEKRMRKILRWDKSDPAPDLVVAVSLAPNAMDRLDLFASLGVPEVWYCDG